MLNITVKGYRLLSSTGDRFPSLPVLPDELIIEILLRVSVRSLLQFKCVSKLWNTLISDPKFAKDHFRVSIADPNMAHQRLVSSGFIGPSKIRSFSTQLLFQNSPTPAQSHCFPTNANCRILGSCHGLLCLYDFRNGYVTLWNPSTRLQSERLPICGSFTYHGFGYDHLNDKYKLLLALKGDTVTKIYTFGPNSFTVIENFPRQETYPLGWQGKFLKGTLNWISKRKRGDPWVILSLDLGTETYGEILLPDGDCKYICKPVLDVLRNCLSVCFFDPIEIHWVLWLMKDYGVRDSWTKLTIIPCHLNHFYQPLCISEDGVVLLTTNCSELVLYNSNDGRFDYLKIKKNCGLHDRHIYYESLKIYLSSGLDGDLAKVSFESDFSKSSISKK
ncbi:F-box/kelch-repeat protein, partial [Mucuna pruriens]